ncbi:hypothetical protein NSZ01_07210 [Nocardioides szechwanensis]|uniref:Uncharacterized protein n=1 Tax=Nocardioides szechwanensis TaxID=1005944 RepID=A0A1G9VDX2_9ACTN|nr:hypothetical protein [Nocardioides szechwanensis]GEP32953.1 hypothetical protein NSZ01_07210 [Nocardioides szechwanensis]SDM70339.1 hypothetical protein SAMN05192576_0737 [Nocardioides szechwanensis]
MTEQLELELRRLFDEDAAAAPVAVALAEHAQRRVRRQRQVRVAWGAGLLVAASVAGVAVLGGSEDLPDRVPQTRPPSSGPTGPVGDSGLTSCAFEYSPKTLADRAIAFDGTAVSVGPARSDRPGSGGGYVGVTFDVHEWFAGGSGTTVTIDMTPPGDSTRDESSESAPGYVLGDRLLVSGEHRWGGTTFDDAIAWTCGFTRYYDEETADSWRDATR